MRPRVIPVRRYPFACARPLDRGPRGGARTAHRAARRGRGAAVARAAEGLRRLPLRRGDRALRPHGRGLSPDAEGDHARHRGGDARLPPRGRGGAARARARPPGLPRAGLADPARDGRRRTTARPEARRAAPRRPRRRRRRRRRPPRRPRSRRTPRRRPAATNAAPAPEATPTPTVAPPPPIADSAPPAPAAPVLLNRPHDGTPVGVLIALGLLALSALLAVLALLARRLGWGEERLAGPRHAWGEATYRAGATWADFVDWIRLGRGPHRL